MKKFVLFSAVLIVLLLSISLACSENSSDPQIIPSESSINIDSFNTKAIDIRIETSSKERYTVSCNIEDSSICRCRWGEWKTADTLPLLITGLKGGQTRIALYLTDVDGKYIGAEVLLEVFVDDKDSILVYNDTKYEINDIRIVNGSAVIYYVFQNDSTEGNWPNLTREVWQNGMECHYDINTGSYDSQIKDGARLSCSLGNKLNSSNDLVELNISIGYSSSAPGLTVFLDPVTGTMMKDKKEIQSFIELYPTLAPTATPEPTATPRPTETPEPTPMVTEEPTQGMDLSELFSITPGSTNHKYSLGKWKTMAGYIGVMYEFFSDGSMISTTIGFAEDFAYPGVYSVQGSYIQMYTYGLNNSINQTYFTISYDDENLIIGNDVFYPVR